MDLKQFGLSHVWALKDSFGKYCGIAVVSGIADFSIFSISISSLGWRVALFNGFLIGTACNIFLCYYIGFTKYVDRYEIPFRRALIHIFLFSSCAFIIQFLALNIISFFFEIGVLYKAGAMIFSFVINFLFRIFFFKVLG